VEEPAVKNTNLAAAFDRWFLNLFPRESVFVYNGGGYQTLSFIPTLATMILGLIAGQVLRRESAPRDKVRWLALGGAALLLGGLLLHGLGLCPIVKRIWTPAWTLFSGGLCFWILAGLYQIIDVWGYSKWAFPLLIFGMNAIALYWMHWTLNGFILDSFRIHLGQEIFLLLGEPFETLLGGIAILAVNWGVLFWMYRNKVFVRI
ncbi:MAG: hypothetical protein RBU29_12715, partial [bacterium]|nr:hypothetical protein [bacterium]